MKTSAPVERPAEFGTPGQQQEGVGDMQLGAHTESVPVPTVVPKAEAAGAHQNLWVLTAQSRSLATGPAPITATVRPTISASSALSPPSAPVSTSARQMASIRPISAIPVPVSATVSAVPLPVPVQPILRPDENASEQTAPSEMTAISSTGTFAPTPGASSIATGVPQQRPQQPRRGLVRPTPSIAPPSQAAIRASHFGSVPATQPLLEQQQSSLQTGNSSSESTFVATSAAAAASGSSGADLSEQQAASMEQDLATRVTRPPTQLLRAGAKRVAAASERADVHPPMPDGSAALPHQNLQELSTAATTSSFETGGAQHSSTAGDFSVGRMPKRLRPDQQHQQVVPMSETPAAGAAETVESQADDAATLLGIHTLTFNSLRLRTYSL